jgi:guanylate kinase
MEALAARLHARAQDAAPVIARRLARAREEIGHWGEYDYVIVNDAFEHAYGQLEAIYLAERLKRGRNRWLEGLVRRLTDQD